MSFVFHRAIDSPYPITNSICLSFYFPEPQVSLTRCLLLPCSSQSPGAVNSIALCVALNLYPFSLETQFPPLNPQFFCCPVSLGTSPACIVSNAAYRSSSNVLLFSKCSVISPSQFSLLVIWRHPVSSCVLQVHVLSNEKLKQACCGWDHLGSSSTVWWKHFYKYHYPPESMLEGNRFLCFLWLNLRSGHIEACKLKEASF